MYHVRDGIFGLAVGDAMGVPTESYKREALLEKPVIKMTPKVSAGIPKGAWSDDTSLTLATIDALSKSGINYTAMADNYVRWFTSNHFCSINESFGIGKTTLKALVRYTQRLEEAYECGSDSEEDCGNGSLKRIIPIAYYFVAHKESDRKILEVVKKTSSITHANEIVICGCYIYVRLVMNLLKGNNKVSALEQVKRLDFSFFSKATVNKYKRILSSDITKLTIDEIKTTSYVVDTLETAIWCFLKADSYQKCAIATTNIGGDTKTIGSLAGALSGIFYGYNNIPIVMLEGLRKKEYIENICEQYEMYLKRL